MASDGGGGKGFGVYGTVGTHGLSSTRPSSLSQRHTGITNSGQPPSLMSHHVGSGRTRTLENMPTSMLTRRRMQDLSSKSDGTHNSHTHSQHMSSLSSAQKPTSTSINSGRPSLSLIRNSEDSSHLGHPAIGATYPIMPQLRPGASLIGNSASSRNGTSLRHGARSSSSTIANGNHSSSGLGLLGLSSHASPMSATLWRSNQPIYQGNGSSNNFSPYSSVFGTTVSPYRQTTPYPATMPNLASSSHPSAAANNKSSAALVLQAVPKDLPENPDVNPTMLAFVDIIHHVMPAKTLFPRRVNQRIQEQSISFNLSAEHAEKIGLNRHINSNTGLIEYGVQLQLRCLRIENSSGPHADAFPPGFSLKVNRTPAQLPPALPTNKPGSDPLRPGRPVNISAQCRISGAVTNNLQVAWSHDPQYNYCLLVDLVTVLTPQELIDRLSITSVKQPEFTRALIRQKLSPEDGEVAVTHLHASLKCPLTKVRITIPARSEHCSHLQCFDLRSYLAMNERKPTWKCPCCDCVASYKSLYLDYFFTDILKQASSTVEKIQFKEDGSWSPVTSDDFPEFVTPVSVKQNSGSVEEEAVHVDLTCSDDEDAPQTKDVKGRSRSNTPKLSVSLEPVVRNVRSIANSETLRPDLMQQNPEIITLDSSDDERDSEPPPKKNKKQLSANLITESAYSMMPDLPSMHAEPFSSASCLPNHL